MPFQRISVKTTHIEFPTDANTATNLVNMDSVYYEQISTVPRVSIKRVYCIISVHIRLKQPNIIRGPKDVVLELILLSPSDLVSGILSRWLGGFN